MPASLPISVSVIIPAYNAEATLDKCLSSLIAQTLEPCEIIVVDDASTDITPQVAKRFPIRFLQLPANRGPGFARNEGARMARGELLAFTDSDCVAKPDWLARMVDALRDSSAVAVTAGYSGSASPGWLPMLQHELLQLRQSQLPDEIASTITSNLVCTRAAFEAVGGFPIYYANSRTSVPVWGNEDEELGWLLSAKGGSIRWLNGGGIMHHFRSDLPGFLRQQMFYTEAILISHIRFPALWRSQSNYSRGSGALHVLLPCAAFAFAVAALLGSAIGSGIAPLYTVFWIAAASLFVTWLCLPVPTIYKLYKSTQGVIRCAACYGTLLATDIAWVAGLIRGSLRALVSEFHDARKGNATTPL